MVFVVFFLLEKEKNIDKNNWIKIINWNYQKYYGIPTQNIYIQSSCSDQPYNPPLSELL